MGLFPLLSLSWVYPSRRPQLQSSSNYIHVDLFKRKLNVEQTALSGDPSLFRFTTKKSRIARLFSPLQGNRNNVPISQRRVFGGFLA